MLLARLGPRGCAIAAGAGATYGVFLMNAAGIGSHRFEIEV